MITWIRNMMKSLHRQLNDEIPIIVLDNVLPTAAYISLRDDLRSRTDFFEGEGNNVSFPGKIAQLDRAIVDPLLDVLQYSKEVGTIYSSAMLTEQREHVRVRRNEIRHRLRSLRNVVLGHLIH